MYKFETNYLQEAKRNPRRSALYIEELHKEIRRLEENISDNTTDYIKALADTIDKLEKDIEGLEEENKHLKLTVLKRNL